MIEGHQRAIGRSWWLCPVSALTNRPESQCIRLGVEREDSAVFISWGFHWRCSTAGLLKQSALPSGSQNGHCFHGRSCCCWPLCTACFLQGRGWARVRSHLLTAALWDRHYESRTTPEQLGLGEGARTRSPRPPESHAARPNQGLDRNHHPLRVRVEGTAGGGPGASRALDSPEHTEAAGENPPQRASSLSRPFSRWCGTHIQPVHFSRENSVEEFCRA